MANPDGSMDGWAALQHQGPEEGFTPEEPLSSGLSPAAAGRQTDGRHEERGCNNGRRTTAKDRRRDEPSASGGHQALMSGGETD